MGTLSLNRSSPMELGVDPNGSACPPAWGPKPRSRALAQSYITRWGSAAAGSWKNAPTVFSFTSA